MFFKVYLLLNGGKLIMVMWGNFIVWVLLLIFVMKIVVDEKIL